MRYLLGLALAGGLSMGLASDAEAQVTFSLGGGRSPQVTVGQPYGYGNYGSYYGTQNYGYNSPQPGYSRGYAYSQPGYYQGNTYRYNSGYRSNSYPSTSNYGYSSGYRGYTYPNYGYGRTYSNRGYTYPNYGGSSGYRIAPGRGGVNITPPAGFGYRIGR
jgi:hypothetical protein